MKSAISQLNQSGLQLDDEAVRTIQAASRPDWNPHEQLVLVTIPDVMKSAPVAETASTMRADLAHPDRRIGAAVSPPSEARNSGKSLTEVPQSDIPAGEMLSDKKSVEPPRAAPMMTPETLPAQGHSIVEPAEKIIPAQASNPHSAVVESLVSRFAGDASCLIHFCDTEQPRRAAEVCLSVGLEFAERINRRVLLLDVSRNDRPLSCLLGVDLAAGFREVIRTELNWRHLVRPTSHPLVDILPAGVLKLNTMASRADFEFQVRRLINELSTQYGGICSCADSAFDLESELIGLCSSGGFLTMDFQRTSRGLAKTAANQLRDSGTRLLGCIAAVLAG